MRSIRHLLLLSALLLPGCMGPYAQQKLRGDVDQLQRELNAIKAESKKGETEQGLRVRLADLGAQLEQIRTDISLLQGRVESLQDSFGKRGDEQLKVRQDLEIRIATLDEKLAEVQKQIASLGTGTGAGTRGSDATASATPLPRLTPPEGAVAPTPHPVKPGLEIKTPPAPTPTPAVAAARENDQQIYQRATEAFDGKRYADARAVFAELITKHPKSEYADNARYWIGESYYAEKDFASAILEFDKVIRNHPNGDKVPAALLKQGYAFLEIGEKEGGVQTLKDLVKKYPKSDEAKKANDRLQKLK